MGDRIAYSQGNPRCRDFCDRFRYLVDRLGGITATADRAGISRPTITFWYNGQRTPDVINLIKLSKSFGVSVDWLLGLKDKENMTSVEELQAASDITGLSNVSIIGLHLLKEKQNIRAYTDLLSLILADPDLEYFLGILEGYFEEENPESLDLSMSRVSINRKDLALFAASNSLQRILERIGPSFKEIPSTAERLEAHAAEKTMIKKEGEIDGERS